MNNYFYEDADIQWKFPADINQLTDSELEAYYFYYNKEDSEWLTSPDSQGPQTMILIGFNTWNTNRSSKTWVGQRRSLLMSSSVGNITLGGNPYESHPTLFK